MTDEKRDVMDELTRDVRTFGPHAQAYWFRIVVVRYRDGVAGTHEVHVPFSRRDVDVRTGKRIPGAVCPYRRLAEKFGYRSHRVSDFVWLRGLEKTNEEAEADARALEVQMLLANGRPSGMFIDGDGI